MYKIINGFVVRGGSNIFEIKDSAFVDFLGIVTREFGSLPEITDYLDYSYIKFKA